MPNILIWRGVYLNRMASQSLQQQKSVIIMMFSQLLGHQVVWLHAQTRGVKSDASTFDEVELATKQTQITNKAIRSIA